MAVASLASVMVGMSSSAYYTSRPFGHGSTAYNATSINNVYASMNTTLEKTYIKVGVTKLNDYDVNEYFSGSVTDHVETTAYELGINKSTSYHQEGKLGYTYTNITMNA